MEHPTDDPRCLQIRHLLDEIAQDANLTESDAIDLFDDVIGHAEEHRGVLVNDEDIDDETVDDLPFGAPPL